MKNHGMNPYLPSWEYVPDGEPHVFGKRVYIYGSHDRFAGYAFCQNDYVCWSAPVDDLTDWQYEGIIYTRAEAAHNEDGRQCLYAPDVTCGPDGRYYLYYALNETSAISVAVCDTPAGKYTYYGDVHYPDGTTLGARPGDEQQFDPGVLTEGDTQLVFIDTPGLHRARNSLGEYMVRQVGSSVSDVDLAVLPADDAGSHRGALLSPCVRHADC